MSYSQFAFLVSTVIIFAAFQVWAGKQQQLDFPETQVHKSLEAAADTQPVSLLTEKSVQDKPQAKPADKTAVGKAGEKAAVKPAKPAVTDSPDKKYKPKLWYTVQLGSYPTAEEAGKVIEGYKAKNVHAFQSEASIKDKKVFRVCTGLYSTMDEAKAALDKVKESTGVNGAFIQKTEQP